MEKFNLQITLASLIHSFRSTAREETRPDIAWGVIVGATILSGAVIAVLSFFSYQWASTIEEVAVTQKIAKETVSVEEIRDVVSYYNEKNRRYQELLLDRPQVPMLGGDSGAVVKAGDVTGGGLLEVGNSAVPAVLTPN